MKRAKAEVIEELEHQRTMLSVLRKRLRILEVQMAQQGDHTQPHIQIEIASLTEQIHQRTSEIEGLESVAVEGRLSLQEVEYRVLLAESWTTPQGKPSVLGAARLELARLRLGISLERAEQLEQDIRAALAHEVVDSLHDSFFTDYLQGYDFTASNEFWKLGLAIRLHVDATIERFSALLPPKLKANNPPLEQGLLQINGFWLYQPTYASSFTKFVETLPRELRAEQSTF